MGATAVLFHDAKATGETRLLASFTRADALCALLNLPWFLGSWWHYDPPVPHTTLVSSR